MNADEWRGVEELYRAAAALPASARPAYLRDACPDPGIRREVEWLLARDAATAGPGVAPAPDSSLPQDLTGRTLGPYRITALLGAGAMGRVYKARDTRLSRDVALKVLPPALADDPDRIARFEREARILASLNHQNIAAIHGLERADGIHALVLELADGETLAARIARGRIPLDEAVVIARQIADALEAAHERGVIHRDLKPANIALTRQGQVKVLDFGLSKAFRPEAFPAPGASADPTTMTAVHTETGAILGTPAYMSPEQARGRDLDKRTDIWAFGCIVFEMLSGRPAFARPTIAETLAAILERDPEWNRLPSTTPDGVRRILQRALAKEPGRRLRDAGDARLELDEILAGPLPPASRARNGGPISRRTAVTAVVLTLLAAGAIAGWRASVGSRTAADRPIMRTTVMIPSSTEIDTENRATSLAISADGARIAYVARRGGVAELYVRDLNSFEARRLAGTEGAGYPFFSPDGTSIGFFAGRTLKRVSIAGGAPVTICDVVVIGRGGTWGPDRTIVFDAGDHGLMRVRDGGGKPQRIVTASPEIDAGIVSWPQFLPGGGSLLATVRGNRVAVLSLDGGEWTELFPGIQGQYVDSGHIVFHAPDVREGELQAVSFDPGSRTLRGMPVSVLEGVFRARNGGGAYFAVSRSGTAIFAPGSFGRTLVRVDRNGRREPLLPERLGFRFPALAPSGQQLAVTIDPRPSQVWVYDLVRGTGIPLSATGHSLSPVWGPDESHVTFTSVGADIYVRAADASTPPARLFERERAQYASDWTSDGSLVFQDDHPTDRSDIWILPRGGGARPLIATPATEMNARLSPDGRWLAYMSDESGPIQVYVRPFPDVNRQKVQVSRNGGHSPRWSRDGRELFYMSGSELFVVAVNGSGESFVAGAPAPLFSGPFDTTQDDNYDVFPDGASFVMVEAEPDARPTHLNVIHNWRSELLRVLPAD